jgi:hypothetical protein
MTALRRAEAIRQRRVTRDAHIAVADFEHIRAWLRAHGRRHWTRTEVMGAMPDVAALAELQPDARGRIVLSPTQVEWIETADFFAHGFGHARAFHPDRKDCAPCARIGRALLNARGAR